MATQLQIRRGTTAENNAFTGAVGELTMNTDTNGIRIHDGTTVGGFDVPTAATADYVVEWQVPTDLNNYTWYRKYKSGWVEQGGYVVNSGNENLTITLPVPMANSIYDWKVGISYNSTENATYYQLSIWDQTATSFVIRRAGNIAKTWQVSGMAA